MSNQITLYILSTREKVIVPLIHRAILGRFLPPDREEDTVYIDLTPFHAYELGVSRKHLLLSYEEDQLVAYDLNSNNGSLLNGECLTWHTGKVLKDGDELMLGSLCIRVYITSEVPYANLQTRPLFAITPLSNQPEYDYETGHEIVKPPAESRATLITSTIKAEPQNPSPITADFETDTYFE